MKSLLNFRIDKFSLVFLGFFLATTFQIIFTIPIVFYKCVLVLYMRLSKKSFYKGILNPWETIFADAGITQDSAIVAVIVLKGQTSVNKYLKLFSANLTQTEEADSQFWRLKCRPESVGGFWFWKFEKKFLFENHVHIRDKTRMLSRKYVHQYLLNRPFQTDMSPWDIHIFSSEKHPKQTYVGIRFHHCLGDARSLTKLIVCSLAGRKIKTAKESPTKTKFNLLLYVILAPFHLAKCNMQGYFIGKQLSSHPWRMENSKLNTSPFNVQFSKQIPVSKFKLAFKRPGKYSTSASMLACVTGAIKQFTKIYHTTLSDKKDLPMVCTLPKANHPNHLKNHFQIGIFESPINSETTGARVKLCRERYMELRESSLVPTCLDISLSLIASLVRPLRLMVPHAETFVTGFSNVAGEMNEIFLGGNKCVDFSLSAGLGRSSIGVGFIGFSYRQYIRVCVISRESVLDSERCRVLVKLLDEEISKVTQQYCELV